MSTAAAGAEMFGEADSDTAPVMSLPMALFASSAKMFDRKNFLTTVAKQMNYIWKPLDGM